MTCFAVLSRRSALQPDTISIPIIHSGKETETVSIPCELYSVIPVFIQIFTLILSATIFPHPPISLCPVKDFTDRFWNHCALGSHVQESQESLFSTSDNSTHSRALGFESSDRSQAKKRPKPPVNLISGCSEIRFLFVIFVFGLSKFLQTRIDRADLFQNFSGLGNLKELFMHVTHSGSKSALP